MESAIEKEIQAFKDVRYQESRQKYLLQSKIDKMFETPLLISTCMLAMAHGSNEINVAAPLAAQMFLMNPDAD